jgi:hypothetical protein
MAQLQAQVPHPVADDVPGLLPARGVTTPAVGVLLQVFIGQGIFKRAAMQIQGHDITCGERVLRQIGQEQFIDDARAGHADPTLRFCGWMCGDHDSAGFLRRAESQVRTVVEGTADPAFWMLEVLIWRKFQASLDLGPLQDLIVFAPHDIPQSCQVNEDGSCPVLPIQAQEGTRFGVVVGLKIALDGCHCPTQFCPVLAIARISKSAEPLMRMGL